MLLIYELLAPIFIGLAANLMGKSGPFQAAKRTFSAGFIPPDYLKSQKTGLFTHVLGHQPNKIGREKLFIS